MAGKGKLPSTLQPLANRILLEKLSECGHLELKGFGLASLISCVFSIVSDCQITLIMSKRCRFGAFVYLCTSPS